MIYFNWYSIIKFHYNNEKTIPISYSCPCLFLLIPCRPFLRFQFFVSFLPLSTSQLSLSLSLSFNSSFYSFIIATSILLPIFTYYEPMISLQLSNLSNTYTLATSLHCVLFLHLLSYGKPLRS